MFLYYSVPQLIFIIIVLPIEYHHKSNTRRKIIPIVYLPNLQKLSIELTDVEL